MVYFIKGIADSSVYKCPQRDKNTTNQAHYRRRYPHPQLFPDKILFKKKKKKKSISLCWNISIYIADDTWNLRTDDFHNHSFYEPHQVKCLDEVLDRM